MKRTVRVLRRALADLEEIRRYVERDRPEAASSLIDRMLDAIESLETLPERGVLPRDERLRTLGFRVLVEREYLILYKTLRAQIRVYRILRGRRRYGQMI